MELRREKGFIPDMRGSKTYSNHNGSVAKWAVGP